MYNRLVRLCNQVDNAWSQIDVQLKRRHDLIPNLVETAKGYMKHERETFEAITNARSRAMGARTVGEAAKAEGALGEALSKFMLVVENYPDLKASLGRKICFWLIVLLALPVILSIVLSMFKLFGTDVQEFLFQLHRYSTLSFALVGIVHIYLTAPAYKR